MSKAKTKSKTSTKAKSSSKKPEQAVPAELVEAAAVDPTNLLKEADKAMASIVEQRQALGELINKIKNGGSSFGGLVPVNHPVVELAENFCKELDQKKREEKEKLAEEQA